MGHHINENGFFQSDKYPELPENKIILDFKDGAAQEALLLYAMLTKDKELAEDIKIAVSNANKWRITEFDNCISGPINIFLLLGRRLLTWLINQPQITDKELLAALESSIKEMKEEIHD